VRLTPSAGTALQCTDATLMQIKAFASEFDTIVTTHMLEHLKERDAAVKLWGKSEIEHLTGLGFLDRRTSLAHVIWITEEEVAKLAATGASVVHNPELNLRLGGGLAPIRRMLDSGINVAIGTDSSTDQSIFGAIKLTSLIHRIGKANPADWVYAREALRMATRGGAEALGIGEHTGSLTVGKLADFICLDLKSPWLVPMTDIPSRLAFFESGRAVTMVVVAGDIVVADGKLTRISEEALIEEALACWQHHRRQNQPLYEMAREMAEILDPEVRKLVSDTTFKKAN
jgi:cytosine/adenosine deaminase-related metal-dependent hydrolase